MLTTNIHLDEGTCSVGLLENAAEFFGSCQLRHAKYPHLRCGE